MFPASSFLQQCDRVGAAGELSTKSDFKEELPPPKISEGAPLIFVSKRNYNTTFPPINKTIKDHRGHQEHKWLQMATWNDLNKQIEENNKLAK